MKEVVGRRVVIYGDGLSAIEAASALMLNGHRIVTLLRGTRRAVHDRPSFTALLNSTGSTLLENAAGLSLIRSGVRFHNGDRVSERECDVLVVSVGEVVSKEWLDVLVCAGILADAGAFQIQTAQSLEQVSRHLPSLPPDEKIRITVSSRADLWDQLFFGRMGVHLAGSALHVGAAAAGVQVSIATGILATQAALGSPIPSHMERPLSQALLNSASIAEVLGASASAELVALVRPIASRCETYGDTTHHTPTVRNRTTPRGSSPLPELTAFLS